jgi:hypothetical protein
LFLRHTGGVEVTRELIDHVLEIAELRNVEIQAQALTLDDSVSLLKRLRGDL